MLCLKQFTHKFGLDWFQNQENYKSAWLYGFEEYENQPLEVDARDYAERETEKSCCMYEEIDNVTKENSKEIVYMRDSTGYDDRYSNVCQPHHD